MDVVQAGKGAGLPSVLLEEGVFTQLSGTQVTQLSLCLPGDGLACSHLPNQDTDEERIRQCHEHRQRQTQGEPLGQTTIDAEAEARGLLQV